MKKVCIDARMLNGSGIGTYLRAILSNLKNVSFKVCLIINSDILKNEKDLASFDLICLDAPIYSLKEQILLPFKIPKCDLFFSPHFNIPIFPIRAKKRLTTIHDVYHLAFLSKFKFFERIYAKFIINKAISFSDKVITVSEFSKSEILKYTKAKEEKIQVIYNAIDLNVFKKTQNKELIENIKNKCKLPEKYFLFVGNLKPHKNLLNILRAFEKTEKEHKEFYLVIIGKNKSLVNALDVTKMLRNKNQLKNKIRIIDFVSTKELPVIYQLATALVFPSFYEGFGYPPLEAMSVACPSIASNIPSLFEICSDSAYYVDPYDYNAISEAMKKIIEDEELKKTLIKKGNVRVKSFTVKDFINKHLEQIEKFL